MNRIEMAHKTKLTSRWQFQRNFCAHIHTYILAIFSQYATSDVRAIWVSAFFFSIQFFFVCTWFFAVSHSFVCFQVEYKFNYLYTYICIEWGAHTQMLLCQTITEDGNFLAFKRNQKTIKQTKKKQYEQEWKRDRQTQKKIEEITIGKIETRKSIHHCGVLRWMRASSSLTLYRYQ